MRILLAIAILLTSTNAYSASNKCKITVGRTQTITVRKGKMNQYNAHVSGTNVIVIRRGKKNVFAADGTVKYKGKTVGKYFCADKLRDWVNG